MKPKQNPIADKVLEAFLELCLSEGVLSVTLQKAAKKARVPFASAHYHWGGKKADLVASSIETVGRNAQAYITNYLDSAMLERKNPLEAYVRGTFSWMRDCEKEAHFWLYSYYDFAIRKKKHKQSIEFVRIARARIERLLFEGAGQGHFSQLKDTQNVAAAIHAVVLGNGILAISGASSEMRDFLEKETWKAVTVLLEAGKQEGSP